MFNLPEESILYKYHFLFPLILIYISLEMVIYDLRRDYEFLHDQFRKKKAGWFKL